MKSMTLERAHPHETMMVLLNPLCERNLSVPPRRSKQRKECKSYKLSNRRAIWWWWERIEWGGEWPMKSWARASPFSETRCIPWCRTHHGGILLLHLSNAIGRGRRLQLQQKMVVENAVGVVIIVRWLWIKVFEFGLHTWLMDFLSTCRIRVLGKEMLRQR